MSNSLWPHGLQHARLPCSSPTPWVCSNSHPLSWWCHPTISSSFIPFSSCLQSFPGSGSFLMSRLFASGGQSIGASAPIFFAMNIQIDFLLDWLVSSPCSPRDSQESSLIPAASEQLLFYPLQRAWLCAQCEASSPSPHGWSDLKPEEQDGDIHLLVLLPFSNTKIVFRNSSCEIGTKIPLRQAVNVSWLLPEPFHTPPVPSYYSFCAKLAPSLLCFPVSLWPLKLPTLVALTFSFFCKRVPPCP